MSGMRAGQALTLDAGHKDCFHVPYVVVEVGYGLKGGDNVRFTDNTFTKITKGASHTENVTADNRHGIIDPFFKGKIPNGTKVAVFLDPSVVGEKLTHSFEINAPGIVADATLVEDLKTEARQLREEIESLKEQRNSYSEPEDYDSCRGCY